MCDISEEGFAEYLLWQASLASEPEAAPVRSPSDEEPATLELPVPVAVPV
jgi:hypothetical protein